MSRPSPFASGRAAAEITTEDLRATVAHSRVLDTCTYAAARELATRCSISTAGLEQINPSLFREAAWIYSGAECIGIASLAGYSGRALGFFDRDDARAQSFPSKGQAEAWVREEMYRAVQR